MAVEVAGVAAARRGTWRTRYSKRKLIPPVFPSRRPAGGSKQPRQAELPVQLTLSSLFRLIARGYYDWYDGA